ncbi:hypothetical protein [Aureispira anguillae]|uniref:Uncharacterized protein n=1 Tax=Aureispira anguillae TaxID=2864201 RepID=A0A915YEH3_9BACT|nr:hypothetical protein [Aureispira anguillae]BDS11624.1 hypothetical protein AsAng_0023380 [Aureispira anguillae]
MPIYKQCYFYLILWLIVSITGPLTAQIKPTQKQAVVTFIFANPINQNPVVGKKFRIEGQENKKQFDLITDKEGKAFVLVPTNDVYAIHLATWQNFASVTIPKGAYQRHEIPVPFYEAPKDGSPLFVEIPVHIRLVDDKGKASHLVEELTIRSGANGKVYQTMTNKDGMANIKLPIGCEYMLNLKGAPNYYKFEIPNKPYAAWTEDVLFERVEGMDKYPSINKALFNFIFYDLNGKLIENERFWVVAQKDGKKYEGITNKQGIAQILVPLNDVYSLNAAYNLNFGQQKIFLTAGSDIVVETIIYESVTSEEWGHRQKKQARIAAKRDSLAKVEEIKQIAMVDSLKALNLEDELIEELVRRNQPIPIKRTFKIRKAVKAKAKIIEQQLKLNPNYFEDKKQPILATLQRFKESWKGKVVVTDITQSMNPYLEEVLIWHLLNLKQGEHTKYLFFNDGNKKMASAKKIGTTGGIYNCEGAWDELGLVINTMHLAIESGLGGGEPPENDLEAVLAGMDKKEDVEELVLIADSYSRVRDMALLSEINIPIRIILCGADETNGFYQGLKSDINEEYLTIAHRTKGSIHTLRQDILNLSEKKEGEIVEIGEHRYILRNRQFIKLSN